MKDLKPGDKVIVYQDPLTRTQPEGEAELISLFRRESLEPPVELWSVRFEGESENRFRSILLE